MYVLGPPPVCAPNKHSLKDLKSNMAYTIDLISVLKSLFDFTLEPDLAGTTNWEVLKETFEDYECSNRRKEIHASCRSLYGSNSPTLTRENFRQIIKWLLDESLGLETWRIGMNVQRVV